MPTDEERLDALLADALAHKAALQEIVRQLMPREADRKMARDRAAAPFEAVYQQAGVKPRALPVMARAISEVEQIFHGSPSRPKADDLPGT